MKPEEAMKIRKDVVGDLEFDIHELQKVIDEALEKQISKKPINNVWDKWCECPECGGIVYFQDAKCDYCPDCGQKIKW